MIRMLPLFVSVLLALPLVLAQETGDTARAPASQEDAAEDATTEDTTTEEAAAEEAGESVGEESAEGDSVEDEAAHEAHDEADPTPAESVLAIVAADARFSMLYEALDAVGFLETLAEEGPFTLFAPTDEAFMQLAEEELEELVNDPDALLRVLSYHVAEGLFSHDDLLEVSEMTTLEGAQVFITVAGEDGGTFMVNEARLLDSGVVAYNGVVYAIDAMLLPPAPNGDHEASR